MMAFHENWIGEEKTKAKEKEKRRKRGEKSLSVETLTISKSKEIIFPDSRVKDGNKKEGVLGRERKDGDVKLFALGKG